MNFQSVFRHVALGASAVILLTGLALAQTPPAPAPTPGASAPMATAPAPTREERRATMHKLRDECRAKTGELRGPERREGMRKCMLDGRAAAGLGPNHIPRERLKAVRDQCRNELKDQRFTEAERRAAMEDCGVKKEPALAKPIACRREADAKKLERGTEPFRTFMRACVTRG